MVVGQGLGVAAIGAGIGVAIALLVTRLMVSLLYGVRPGDPLTLIAVALLMLFVACAAAWAPARRAARVDPLASMRLQ